VTRLRAAVVGHVEWIEFGRVDHVPNSGEIAHATSFWEEPGGGGAVAAGQLCRLAGGCEFFTAVGDDAIGERMVHGLQRRGVTVHAAVRRGTPTRRAVTLVDPSGERTITTLGERLEPALADPLPWDLLDGADAVYVTAGDPGAYRAARRARAMVVASRAMGQLVSADVEPDALVGSATDPAERIDVASLPWAPSLVVRTEGSRGGTYDAAGVSARYEPAPPPGPIVDTYGAGDSFAGGLTFGLGLGLDVPAAIELAARCGAAVVAGRGPFEGQVGAG
jgi:ribokinase